MEKQQKIGLFGLEHSNRDFTSPSSWGKNQFNSSFPASLACYMGEKQIFPVYLTLSETLRVEHTKISVENLFGLPHNSDDLFFSFEESFTPYADLIIGQLPRVDLVTRNRGKENKDCLAAFEIKLTALPDSSTYNSTDEKEYGCEIVVRPDTIIYIALSLSKLYTKKQTALKAILFPITSIITDWEDAQMIRPHIEPFCQALEQIQKDNLENQTPLLLQPVWKTIGKKGILAEYCYDLFVWSNLSLMKLFIDQGKGQKGNFSRPERSVVWLVKMLDDFANHGKINPKHVIDRLTYNTKNDKAFALNGKITRFYMQSPELTKPRIPKYATKEIILGGGQNYLSPERRLDAIVINSPDLFE